MTTSKGTGYSAGPRDTLLHMLQRAVERAGDDIYHDIQRTTCTFRGFGVKWVSSWSYGQQVNSRLATAAVLKNRRVGL